MAVSTTNDYSGPYTPNGVTTAFSFTFKAMSADEVAVVLVDDNGIEQTVNPDNYTVTLTTNGGTATFATAPASGPELYVVSVPDFTQQIEFENNGPFLPATHDEANDRAAVRAIWLKNQLDRVMMVPLGESPPNLPALADRLNRVPVGASDGGLDFIDLSSVYDGAQALLASHRATMAGLTGVSAGQSALLSEDGRAGQFVASSDNLASNVTDDPAQGRYVAFSSDSTGAGGAWVRKYNGPVKPQWFGASPDGATDNATSLQRAATAAFEYEETLDLSTEYREAIWGTTAPIVCKHGLKVVGGGYRTQVKGLSGFPATTTTPGHPTAPGTFTIHAPLLLFEAPQAGGRMPFVEHLRLNGNGFAPVGFTMIGGAKNYAGFIRIDSTTHAATIWDGVQNFLMMDIQGYETGQYGFKMQNACYNGTAITCDSRTVSIADLYADQDSAYPYYNIPLLSGIAGMTGCTWIGGIVEDAKGFNASTAPDVKKTNCYRFVRGGRNTIIGSQATGPATQNIYEGPEVVRNRYVGVKVYGKNRNEQIAGYLESFQSEFIGCITAFFGPTSGTTVANLWEVRGNGRAKFEDMDWATNFYTNKLIANVSSSVNDTRRIIHIPITRSGSLSARNDNSLADKVDAITEYYATDDRRVYRYDYRSTITNKWGDLPTYTAGDTSPSIQCPDRHVTMMVANAGATTLTALDDVLSGQLVTLGFLDGNTTLTHGTSNFVLSGGVNWTPNANDTITLLKQSASPFYLVEVARSANP